MNGRNKMSPDFGGCAMTAHPRRSVFILPKKVSASGDTKDVSPDMAARNHDTKHDARGGILSLLLSVIMLVKPSLASAQATQPQGPVKEPQKIEQPDVDKQALNKQLLKYVASARNKFFATMFVNDALTKGADVNTADEYGLTPLHHAAKRRDKNLIIRFLTHGATVDSKDNAGRTPLHYAAGAGISWSVPEKWDTSIIELLLGKGANIIAQDNMGRTPLHYAALRRIKPAVETLLSRGADVDVVDNLVVCHR